MKRIVILTGAGISAESGVPTFRDAGGLWEGHAIEDVVTPEAFLRNPEIVHRFYNQRRSGLSSCQPNAAHVALASLQSAWPDAITLVTQNVDDLHERGGSDVVVHMHGELLRAKCVACRKRVQQHADLSTDSACRHCGRVGTMRPDIVWFGEIPYCMNEIQLALSEAEIFAAIGTSGLVYPAAGFVSVAREFGCHTMEFNLERTESSARFHETRPGPASQTVPAWVSSLLRHAR